MPASMIRAPTGLRLNVIGSSMAIVATEPTPGSTPISVPSRQPISAKNRCFSVSATPKPRIRLWKTSIAASLVDRAVFDEVRADRERQREAFHEHHHRHDDQDDAED